MDSLAARRPEMTYSLAMACAQDVGNRSAREHGRKAWELKDYAAAVAEFERLWPLGGGLV